MKEFKSVDNKNNNNNRKRSKTSLACAACKSRKTKCSGGPAPCKSCIRLHTRCVFHPGTDMRRRDSKKHFGAYKALLDSFVASTREGDMEHANLLYETISLTDTSGKLAEIAQSYVQAVDTCLQQGPELRQRQQSEFSFQLRRTTAVLFTHSMARNSIDADFSPDNSSTSTLTQFHGAADGNDTVVPADTSRSSSSKLIGNEEVCTWDPEYHTDTRRETTHSGTCTIKQSTLGLPRDHQPLNDFDSLQQLWHGQSGQSALPRIADIPLLRDSCDPVSLAADDPLSKSIISFRDGTRRAIQHGTDLWPILGTAVPDLTTYFQQKESYSTSSVWSWACHFARAFPDIPVPVQLGIIYKAGIQMRVSARLKAVSSG